MGHDGSPVAEAEGGSRIENRESIFNKDLQKHKSSDGENQGLDLDHCDDVIKAIRQYNIAA